MKPLYSDNDVKTQAQQHNFKALSQNQESTTAMEIRLLSEVEKVWIIYDVDESGELEYDEIKSYLKEMAFPHLEIADSELRAVFDTIDVDNSGSIDKSELLDFIRKLVQKHQNLNFKQNIDPN